MRNSLRRPGLQRHRHGCSRGPLAYLTLWPTGGTTPLVSTLNDVDASIVANAAIVPAGTDGSINSYVTDLMLDISGYFAP